MPMIGSAPARFRPLLWAVLALTFACLTLAAVVWAPHALAAILPLVALWGQSAWGFFPPQQARLVGIAGLAHTPVALSITASFMYLGFSLGDQSSLR
jgi:predicted MFS family arabinose efflux permease